MKKTHDLAALPHQKGAVTKSVKTILLPFLERSEV